MKYPARLGKILSSLRALGRGRSGLLALNYHRVGDARGSLLDRALWSATEEAFAQQVRFYKAHLDLISVADLAQVRSGRGRYGIITFDDGYRDNYEVAFPILKAERATATFFITSGYIDAPRLSWWDEIAYRVRASRESRIDLPGWLAAPVIFDEPERETAVRTLLRRYKQLTSERTGAFLNAIATAAGPPRQPAAPDDVWMTWNMLREMHRAGMTIGGHTVNHAVLARTRLADQREEIAGCARRLEQEISQPMLYFSYPVGGRTSFDEATRGCLRDAGVRYAFSYYGGFRSADDWDDYDIRRVPMEPDVTFSRFRRIVSLPQLFA